MIGNKQSYEQKNILETKDDIKDVTNLYYSYRYSSYIEVGGKQRGGEGQHERGKVNIGRKDT